MPEGNQEEFEKHRSLLEGLAYRMCGVLADAQDLVQETHIKWCDANHSEIANPRAWLVSVCSRLAIDLMKSARGRRVHYVGTWLPEPLLEFPQPNPDERAELDDSVSMALMHAMERLTPSERAAFLLHDVFRYDFGEVASIIGKSEDTCRKSASRARRAVREGRPRYAATPDTHRNLLNAFLEAARDGTPENLKTLLSNSVEFHSDSGGRVKTSPTVLHGAEAVSEFFLKIWRENAASTQNIRIVEQWFNGQPGVLLYQGSLLCVAIALSLKDRQISQIFALRNPEKLAHFNSKPGLSIN